MKKNKNCDSTKNKLLCTVNTPSDLKRLTDAELDRLSDEIREFLVENVTKTGGHLASNLGVVELTLAIHRCMDSPKDHIIWDVGHQSYVHKLVTGRRDDFERLRRGGGLSGFTSRAESVHDSFGAGHSSTSVSAALGFAQADKLNGSDAYSVAVVGDGAFTGGMVHEALNNCDNDLHLIIILNENEMSISKNTGRFAKTMARLRTGRGYLKTKKATRNFVLKLPLIGKWLFRRIRDIKKAFKNMMYGSNYFEDLGLYYLGPVDGHDRAAIERLLNEAKVAGKSAVIHVKTVKGNGYSPAETDPGLYHGMSPADKPVAEINFSRLMGERLTMLADEDKSICAVTAAMCDGTGLTSFAEHHRERFFDVGIAEPHALTFAAGLAAADMKPVVCIYSTFLQRGYDSIVHDIALQKLPVTICVDRAGLNSSDGATHHGIFDVSFLSAIPDIDIYTPITAGTLAASLDTALNSGRPSVIRYPNGFENAETVESFYGDGDFSLKLARADFEIADAPSVIIITDGRVVVEAQRAKAKLAEDGVAVGLILLEKIKPYGECAAAVNHLLPKNVKLIVFLEEEIKNGGMGMVLNEVMTELGIASNAERAIMATDDSFVIRTDNESIYKAAGIDSESIVKRIISEMSKNDNKQ